MEDKWRMKQWGGMESVIVSVLDGRKTSRSTRLDSPGSAASIGALEFIIDGFTALLVTETFSVIVNVWLENSPEPCSSLILDNKTLY